MNKEYYITLDEFSSLNNPALTDVQIAKIIEPTPESEIEVKEENGFTFNTVKSSYVKARLNYVFGWNYDFSIISKERISNEIIVHGKLTVRSNGYILTREQFGKSTFSAKDGFVGNAYKSAATDSLKKCASELGFFWDIYSQGFGFSSGEVETYQEKKITERLNYFLSRAESLEELDDIVERFQGSNEVTVDHKKMIAEFTEKLTLNIQ